jgi:murein DD-endopeptidase MepM/ murein hydrolase activator NlpD
VQRFPSAQAYANRHIGLRLVWSSRKKERYVEIGRAPLIIGGFAVFLLCGWYLVATAYLIFRDEMLAGLLRSQAEMQYAYEDRIASLRAHLDRVASRQLVDQDSFEGKLADIAARQVKLETRSAALSSLAAAASKSGVKLGNVPQSAENANAEAVEAAKPQPEGEGIGRQGSITLPVRSSVAIGTYSAEDQIAASDNLKQTVSAIAESITDVEKRQNAMLATLEKSVGEGPARFRAVLNEIGLDAARFRIAAQKPAKSSGGVGGPLIPLDGLPADFASRIGRIQSALATQAAFDRALQSVPLRRPVPAESAITSGFGPRSDPFLVRAAMHSGIDFRGDTGDAARATAPGRITDAGFNGGYGKMVEIDHGYGITTRYAHLSAIDVEVGDIVERGQIIGRIGSTGRSTGPHLHYETRIDGEAVDPMRFLRAAKHR